MGSEAPTRQQVLRTGQASAAPPCSLMNSRRFMCGWPRLARDHFGCCTGRLQSLDYLVGAGEQDWRHFEAERSCGLEVNHKLVLGRRLHRQVGRLLALEDAIDVSGRAPALVDQIGSIGD